MILLGFFVFLGFHPRLPFHVSPKLNSQDIGSIFLLGIFSGLATTCCAPVLAGVIALSVLPGSIFWGGMYSLVYVLGMVLPLFIISLFFDKINFTERFSVLQRPISYKILGKEIIVGLSQFLAGIMFFLIGALILFLTLTDRLRMESDMLLKVNILTAKYLYILKDVIGNIPWFVFPALFIAIIFIIIKTSLKQIK